MFGSLREALGLSLWGVKTELDADWSKFVVGVYLRNDNMAAYSKLLHYSTHTCYEVGHTWNPSCLGSVSEIGFHGIKVALKIYTPLYLVSGCCRLIHTHLHR